MCLPVPRVPVIIRDSWGQQGPRRSCWERGRMWGLQPRAQGPWRMSTHPSPGKQLLVQAAPPLPQKASSSLQGRAQVLGGLGWVVGLSEPHLPQHLLDQL